MKYLLILCVIFNIQRFSTHDGSGVRTVVFYKGCPLRCGWCSNPESQAFGTSLMYDEKSCKALGDCMKTGIEGIWMADDNRLKINHQLISEPGLLRDVCVSKSLSVSGEQMDPQEIVREIEKDLPFYQQDGGVTLSGGEPLSQGDELIELLGELKKRNINVDVESSLHVPWEKVARCIGWVDTFLVDLKHIDQRKFEKHTGGRLSLVTHNMKKLNSSGAPMIFRIPVIPGFNHSENEMFKMIDFITTLDRVSEIHLLPYHSFGMEKYKMLGMDYGYIDQKPVMEEELRTYIRYAEQKGFRIKIGG